MSGLVSKRGLRAGDHVRYIGGDQLYYDAPDWVVLEILPEEVAAIWSTSLSAGHKCSTGYLSKRICPRCGSDVTHGGAAWECKACQNVQVVS